LRIIPKVKSLDESREFQRITKSVKIQLVQFQANTINRLAENLILSTIHERMRDFGYSEKIIQGTTVSGVNIISSKKFRIFFHSEYFGDNNFDVAVGREKGTTDHFIKPDKKKALFFGGNKFSKGHFVSGIIPSHIIERTLDDIAEPFLDEYNRTKKLWLEQNYGGLAAIAL